MEWGCKYNPQNLEFACKSMKICRKILNFAEKQESEAILSFGLTAPTSTYSVLETMSVTKQLIKQVQLITCVQMCMIV